MMRDYETTKALLRGIAAGFRAIGNVLASKTCDDAADAIEELVAELVAIRNQLPTWISVEEQLPETADRVLTCSGEYVTENWLCTTIDVEGKHLVWAYYDGLVTHWMPLPEPPKGVE